MINMVISGGQSGSDIAGLIAAKKAGIKTGGTMPKGFRTLDGPKPEYASLYNLVEHSSYSYVPRTYENVKNSEGTIRFASDFNSSGELCTLKAIFYYKKPYFDIPVLDVSSNVINKRFHPEAAANWVKNNNIKILNIAGNSNSTSPGIGNFVERYLDKLFQIL